MRAATVTPVTPATRSPAVTVATRVYEPEAAAAAHRLGALVRTLENAGYDVTVLTTTARGAGPSTRRVRRWPALRDRSGAVRGYIQYLSYDLPLFFRLLFGPRADLVVVEPPPTTGFVARVACWIRRTPYVYFSADVLSSAVEGIGAHQGVVAAVKWLERRSVRAARGVLAVSDEVRKRVVALGARAERVAMVGTGIDTERYSPVGPTASEPFPYFVYAGTMSEVHGAGVFIDAFTMVAERHPTVRLKIFGTGVEFDEIRSRAASLGDRVTFSRVVPPSELAKWLRGANAALASVRPGRGYDFAFATKALASLACGTPVVYAGVGPLAQNIRTDGLGWAVEWDADQVAEAMLDSLAAPRTRPDEALAGWVEQHHSLHAVALRAANAIGGWLGPGYPTAPK